MTNPSESASSPGSEPATEFGSTRDGLSQLRRHWPVDDARASVLLVHGIGEHSGRYLHLGQGLANHGFDTLAFDNRGFGQSGGRRAFVDDFDQYLDDVEDLLLLRRQLDVPVVLLGHSLGGLISTTYLVSARPQPDLAVLSAPALSADVPMWQRVAAPIIGRIRPQLFIKSEIDASILSRDPEVQDAYVNDPLLVSGATAGLALAIFNAMETTSAALERVRIPGYVLHGDADELVPPAASEAIGLLSEVERRLWPSLRHECFNEPEKDEVLGEVVSWINAQLEGSPDSRST